MTAPLTGAAVDTLGKGFKGVALRSALGLPSVQRPALASYTTPRDANDLGSTQPRQVRTPEASRRS